jgi:uncharacterized protein YyaL (SSP411 family)
MMLSALSTYHAGTPQVVIVGEPQDAATQALLDVTRRHYRPATIVVPVWPQYRDHLVRLLPWIAGMQARDGRATRMCVEFACQAPTVDHRTDDATVIQNSDAKCKSPQSIRIGLSLISISG